MKLRSRSKNSGLLKISRNQNCPLCTQDIGTCFLKVRSDYAQDLRNKWKTAGLKANKTPLNRPGLFIMSSPSYIPFNSGPLYPEVGPRKPGSCWHLLTVGLTILSAALASFIFVKSIVLYAHVDHFVEECTIDWSSHFACHYLWLWLR